jgi:hypothetical protein
MEKNFEEPVVTSYERDELLVEIVFTQGGSGQ